MKIPRLPALLKALALGTAISTSIALVWWAVLYASFGKVEASEQIGKQLLFLIGMLPLNFVFAHLALQSRNK